MYYAIIKNNEIIGTSECPYANKDIENIEISEEIFNEIEKYTYFEGEIIPDTHYEEKQAKKEQERINRLSMTRSDFFDGTIKAFGIDGNDLLIIIENILNTLKIDTIEKKIAINNYRNALNFYRNHTLFTLLSNIPIKISEDLTITITDKQWDKFFDETDKKNPEAYKELL
ncbi:hypothetical protein J6O86_03855 [bacterium]|nr:hypothetical protein [bacterium]